MKSSHFALADLPSLSRMPAAHGALMPSVQLTGATVFDVVITVILINVGDT